MNNGRTLMVLGGLLMVPGSMVAQEALRTAVSADRALQAPAPQSARGDGGLYWGPVQFSAGASLSLEYDDNIRAGSVGPEGRIRDFIIRPRADVSALWPVTETSSLTFGLGVGYAFYADHSEYDYLEISPLSALSYSVTIEDLVLTVYDQVSYTGDVLDQPEITGQARYPRLENTSGVRATYTISDVILQGGYSYYRFWAFDDVYNYLERGSHQMFARGGYMIAERTQAGVEGSVSLTEYVRQLRNDYDSYSFGPYVDWTVVESLTLGARGGYVMYKYHETSLQPGLPQGTLLEDQSSWYVGLNARHDLTEFISHNLSATRDVGAGINAQYIERFDLSYGISWQITDNVDLSGGVSYGKGRETGGVSPEEYDRVGFSAGVGYALSTHLRTGLSYRYFNRTSDVVGRGYDRNVVALNVSYRF